VIDRLRLVSAETVDLRAVLRTIRSGEAPLETYAEYIGTTCVQLDDLIRTLDGDDSIRHIQNTWEQMKACRLMQDPRGSYQPQEQLQLLGILDGQCRQIIYWTGTLTVPERLKDWLELSEPGYAIPFHAVFEDEVSEAEDRQKILNHLAWSPVFLKKVGGIVDPESGLVYRYDSRKSVGEMALSVVWVALGITLGGVIVWGLQQFPPLSAQPLEHLLVGWAAVLGGLVVHSVIGTTKRMRADNSIPAGLPINRFLILLSAKMGFVLFRLMVALVGYLGLLYAVGAPQFTSFIVNAFLVGYSLDSVVELFGSTMDQRSAAQLANLRKQLGTQG